MSILTWFAKLFKWAKVDAAKIAVAITEGVQTALKSGVVGALADAISAVFPNVKHLPQDVVDELQKWIPKVLAAELALQGLPDNPTEQDILDFENKVMAAFGVHDNKSKLYTTLGAQVYGILKKYSEGTSPTFAQLVLDLEEAYQDYLKDKAEADAGGVTV
jgi:hypothetical protein